MTPQEEIELIVNAAYLRGCDSNFKVAIAAMQEEEIWRLNRIIICIFENGVISNSSPSSAYMRYCRVNVYGCIGTEDAVEKINKEIYSKERARAAVLIDEIYRLAKIASAITRNETK